MAKINFDVNIHCVWHRFIILNKLRVHKDVRIPEVNFYFCYNYIVSAILHPNFPSLLFIGFRFPEASFFYRFLLMRTIINNKDFHLHTRLVFRTFGYINRLFFPLR